MDIDVNRTEGNAWKGLELGYQDANQVIVSVLYRVHCMVIHDIWYHLTLLRILTIYHFVIVNFTRGSSFSLVQEKEYGNNDNSYD